MSDKKQRLAWGISSDCQNAFATYVKQEQDPADEDTRKKYSHFLGKEKLEIRQIRAKCINRKYRRKAIVSGKHCSPMIIRLSVCKGTLFSGLNTIIIIIR